MTVQKPHSSFPGGAKAAFPRSRHFQSCGRDQRRQGCAAPAGLDLDASARRGRKMTKTYCVVDVADTEASAALVNGPRNPVGGRLFAF